jgi:hypothetical protein
VTILDIDITSARADIEATHDLLEKALKLSGLVSTLFAEAGWPLVVVGGSAVEFYTEGGYMSGDIDFCRQRASAIPLRLAQDLMSQLGGKGGPRSWKVCGLFVDLLGCLENEARTFLREIQTPYGKISLIPLELAIVERTFIAVYPKRQDEDYAVAKKLAARALANPESCDWNEVLRIAGLPAFDIRDAVEALKTEVENGLAN